MRWKIEVVRVRWRATWSWQGPYIYTEEGLWTQTTNIFSLPVKLPQVVAVVVAVAIAAPVPVPVPGQTRPGRLREAEGRHRVQTRQASVRLRIDGGSLRLAEKDYTITMGWAPIRDGGWG